MTRPRLILAIRVCVLLTLALWYSAEVFFLLLPALVMPPLFQHCPTCQPCSSCLDSLWPAYVDVEISGVADDSCTDCEGFDGVYSVPVSCVFGVCCAASGNFGAVTSCGTLTIVVEFSATYDIAVRFTVTNVFSQVANFILTAASKPDCSRWSGQVVPFSSESGSFCDFTGATVTITAA